MRAKPTQCINIPSLILIILAIVSFGLFAQQYINIAGTITSKYEQPDFTGNNFRMTYFSDQDGALKKFPRFLYKNIL